MRTERLLCVCLLAAATLPYLNALGNGFAFDDRSMIVGNPIVRQAEPPIPEVFTQPYYPGALYRPLTFLGYWFQHRLHGANAGAFHLVNVALHAVVTLLVFAVGRRFGLGRLGAFAAAVVFAVHPIHTEAVTNVVGRAEVLSAAAVLGALLCTLRARDEDGEEREWLTVAAVLFAAGLLCKENAFVFLPLLAIALAMAEGWWPGDPRRDRPTYGSLARPFVLFGAIAAGYLGLRWLLFGTLTLGDDVSWLDNPLAHTPALVRAGTATVVLFDSLAQLVVPWHLAADYSFDQVPLVESPADPRLLLALATLTALALLFWRLRRRAPAAAAGVLFFLASISLTSNFLFAIGTIRGERLLYLPSVGFAIAVGALLAPVLRRHRQWAPAALGVLVAVLAARTWVRNADWASDLTLFTATVETSPYSAKAHHNLGAALAEEGRHAEAALAFRQALQLHPEYEDAAFGIARMYELRGMTAGALRWYERTLEIDPRHVNAFLNRGAIHYNRGDLPEAAETFRAGLAVAPEDPRLITAVGFVHLAEGKVAEARAAFEEAQRRAPDDPEPRRGLQLAQRLAAAPQGS